MQWVYMLPFYPEVSMLDVGAVVALVQKKTKVKVKYIQC